MAPRRGGRAGAALRQGGGEPAALRGARGGHAGNAKLPGIRGFHRPPPQQCTRAIQVKAIGQRGLPIRDLKRESKKFQSDRMRKQAEIGKDSKAWQRCVARYAQP